jgi:cytochrome c-type biogenesis protein CcmF
MSYVGATLGFWILLSSLSEPVNRLRRGQGMPAAMIGMTVAHIGLSLFVLGATVVESRTIERDIALKPGQGSDLAGYVFTYQGGEAIDGPNYDGFRGHVIVTRNGQTVATLAPEKRRYWVQGSVMTEAGIAAGWNRDLFVALGEDVGGGAWSLRLQYRPLIRFIWLGALIMALGGITTLFDRRYRAIEARAAANAETVAGTRSAT